MFLYGLENTNSSFAFIVQVTCCCGPNITVPQSGASSKFGLDRAVLGLDSKEEELLHLHASGLLIKLTPKPPAIPV